MHAAANQLIDGLIRSFANDVPTGHFQPAKNAHDRNIGPLREPCAIGAVPQFFDVMWVRIMKMAAKHIVRHGADDIGAKGGVINFAHARDAATGRDPHKDEIPSTVTRRRVSENKGFDRL